MELRINVHECCQFQARPLNLSKAHIIWCIEWSVVLHPISHLGIGIVGVYFQSNMIVCFVQTISSGAGELTRAKGRLDGRENYKPHQGLGL